MTGGDVPPARQCTYGTCTDEAINGDHAAPLCETHLAAIGEGVASSDKSDVSNPSSSSDNESET